MPAPGVGNDVTRIRAVDGSHGALILDDVAILRVAAIRTRRAPARELAAVSGVIVIRVFTAEAARIDDPAYKYTGRDIQLVAARVKKLSLDIDVAFVDRASIPAREVVAGVIGVVTGSIPRQRVIPAVAVPIVHAPARVAARSVDRSVVVPEIDVGRRERRQSAGRAVIVVKVVIVVAAARGNIRREHEANVGRSRCCSR